MKHPALIILLVLCLCVLPAGAVILEVTVSGTVSAFSTENNTLTIANPAQYGCSYPASGTPVCSFTPMKSTSLSGTVPDKSAFSVFSPGDPVVATSLGGAGGQWITIAKLSGTAPGKSVTDIVGDPSTLEIPLAGGYSLGLVTDPDCKACSGTTCTAASANVSIKSQDLLVSSGDLKPGATLAYSGRNDGSSVTVTFVSGQAPSSSCPGRDAMMTGPQAISIYNVHVVPPIGSGTPPVQNLSATPSTTPPLVTMPVEARPTPTKAAVFPAVAIGALALAALPGVFRRR